MSPRLEGGHTEGVTATAMRGAAHEGVHARLDLEVWTTGARPSYPTGSNIVTGFGRMKDWVGAVGTGSEPSTTDTVGCFTRLGEDY